MMEAYLKKFAHEEAQRVDMLPKGKVWHHVVAVPVLAEFHFIFELIDSLKRTEAYQSGEAILVIFVINHRQDHDSSVKNDNEQTLNGLLNEPEGWLLDHPPNSWSESPIDFLIVDRTKPSTEFCPKSGVGLARKIGVDIALSLKNSGRIISEWVHTTDGDAKVPSTYFKQPSGDCYIYPFAHYPSSKDSHWEALILYEIWLRYYRLGLQYGLSPYSIHTIGSLIAVRFQAYAAVRGFNNRAAGEDFYFLNKILKNFNCHEGTDDPIQLRCRPSLRVPFGTGQGTLKIKDLLDQEKSFEMYSPEVFVTLKKLHQTLIDARSTEDFREQITIIVSDNPELDKIFQDWQFPGHLVKATNRSKSFEGAKKQFHTWFDGLKTLKFIHQMRDECYPNVPYRQALEESRFINLQLDAPEKILADLRSIDRSKHQTI